MTRAEGRRTSFDKKHDSLDDGSFYRYILSHSLRGNRYLLLLFAVMNLFLLVPDLLLIKSIGTRVLIFFIRVIYSGSLILFIYIIRKFKYFETYSLLLSAIELTGVAIFLFVFSSYPDPNFYIQSMGMMIILIGIFLFPNKWLNMLLVSVVSASAFFILSFNIIEEISPNHLLAGTFYVTTALLLCALGAKSTESYRVREYNSLLDLKTISTTDSLTKACNRYQLEQESKKWMIKCRSKNKPLSLAFIDVDNLKTINDIHGHLIGDQVLIEIVTRMRKHLREKDIISRWGGDEFVVLMPEADLQTSLQLIEKIRASITGDIFPGGVSTSCSFGIAEMEKDSTFPSLLFAADQLMYDGKKKGKNRIETR
jgi:diguanylate cyclase (GGDEF)-like protein